MRPLILIGKNGSQHALIIEFDFPQKLICILWEQNALDLAVHILSECLPHCDHLRKFLISFTKKNY